MKQQIRRSKMRKQKHESFMDKHFKAVCGVLFAGFIYLFGLFLYTHSRMVNHDHISFCDGAYSWVENHYVCSDTTALETLIYCIYFPCLYIDTMFRGNYYHLESSYKEGFSQVPE